MEKKMYEKPLVEIIEISLEKRIAVGGDYEIGEGEDMENPDGIGSVQQRDPYREMY